MNHALEVLRDKLRDINKSIKIANNRHCQWLQVNTSNFNMDFALDQKDVIEKAIKILEREN